MCLQMFARSDTTCSTCRSENFISAALKSAKNQTLFKATATWQRITSAIERSIKSIVTNAGAPGGSFSHKEEQRWAWASVGGGQNGHLPSQEIGTALQV